MKFSKKDILGIAELSAEEITSILDSASVMKRIILSGQKKTNYLRGTAVLTLFMKTAQEQGYPLNWLQNTWVPIR